MKGFRRSFRMFTCVCVCVCVYVNEEDVCVFVCMYGKRNRQWTYLIGDALLLHRAHVGIVDLLPY